ncbi:hypothetical protein NHF40_03195 [Maricaulaceae bacterium EIL42A08]|nr:hypothetical protein [Maricaulaceae bacterium EIL42A08]
MRVSPLTLMVCSSLMFTGAVQAQDAEDDAPPPAFPETEIFLFEYDVANEDDALSHGQNVTRRVGYDNQPYFTADSATFLYSRDDGAQTDIWEYDIESGTHTQITRTPESEFSPTPSPDNQMISMVFERSNSIWHLERSNPDEPQPTLAPAGIIEPVGYFARNHETGAIFFWSRFGFNVALTQADGPGYHFITGHAVPSTPHLIPGSDEFSFVHRQTNEQVWIKAFDPETRAIRPLTLLVGTNANYTWAPDGSILQIEGTGLYRWHADGEGWEMISDLADHGMASAYRIAASPDGTRIAVVGLPAE